MRLWIGMIPFPLCVGFQFLYLWAAYVTLAAKPRRARRYKALNNVLIVAMTMLATSVSIYVLETVGGRDNLDRNILIHVILAFAIFLKGLF